MAVVARVGLCLLLLVVSRGVHGKPFWFCEFFCGDDDDSSSSSSESSLESFLDSLFDPCMGCPVSNKPKASTTTAKPMQTHPDVSVVVPPSSSGVNITLGNENNSWVFKLMPWASTAGAPGFATPAAPAATAAPTPAPDAAATTAAAAAAETTAAPAA